jgi:hypothetical protein
LEHRISTVIAVPLATDAWARHPRCDMSTSMPSTDLVQDILIGQPTVWFSVTGFVPCPGDGRPEISSM